MPIREAINDAHTHTHTSTLTVRKTEREHVYSQWSPGSGKAENMIHSPEIIMRRSTCALHNEKQKQETSEL